MTTSFKMPRVNCGIRTNPDSA